MKRGVLIFLFILIGSLCCINANYIIKTSIGGNYSINESTIFTYNISIENNNTDINSNITKINITLPSNIKFITGTQGTNANSNIFENASNSLVWSNETTYILNISELKYFWFNANSTTPGNYNITVMISNTIDAQLVEIHVKILSTAVICTENWTCGNWTSCINSTQNRTCADLNNCGTNISKPISINNSCNFTISPVICTPQWNCTTWSPCLNNIQIQTCVDINSCNNNTNKPAENRTCQIAPPPCAPQWDCTDWKPNECPKNQTLNRECTDLNDCGVSSGKPPESKSCEYKSKISGTFIAIGIGILVLIIIVAFIVYHFLNKPEPTAYPFQQEQGFSQPQIYSYPPPPRGPPPKIPILPQRSPMMQDQSL